LKAARGVAKSFDESIDCGRIDRTSVTVVTIDPHDARDFDDAISLEAAGKGHWRLGVHIADVSHFVQPRAPLDREARDRATSVYLPDQVIPMLPEIISNNLASLQPDRVRYALTAWIGFTDDGTRTDVELEKTAIRSNHRFTYEDVDGYLADPKAWKRRLSPEVHTLLGDMHRLAMTLRGRRFERGSLELSMPEVRVDLDRDGRVTGAHVVENSESHQIIEEFMLAANEAVADLLQGREILFLRRVHANPDPRKLQALTEFATELGFETESLESRFAIQQLLDKVRGLPQQHAVNFAVLRSMQKAVYSPEDEGHYALASDCYCHFTSPIRRYPDLTVHRLITAVLANGNRSEDRTGTLPPQGKAGARKDGGTGSKKPVSEVGELLALGEHCSQREQRAEKAERELTKVKLLEYLSQRIGEEMDGIITGVEEFGLFIQGIELPAEGFVHISAISDDYYRLDRASHTLTGHREGNQFRLGDAVRVTVAHVDVGRRELDFRLISRLGHAIKKLPAGPESSKTERSAPRSGRSRTGSGRPAKGTGRTAARKKTRGRRKKS
ncbi:MAG: ribonuclease R family protein, partial [Pirellulales bacterium]